MNSNPSSGGDHGINSAVKALDNEHNMPENAGKQGATQASTSGATAFNKDGAIGSMFKADGAIGGMAQKVGGPFDKEGTIGKNFNADGAIGGTVQENLGKNTRET